MRKAERLGDSLSGNMPGTVARRRLRAFESFIDAGASPYQSEGGVAIEKLREKVARQEKWTSGYRQMLDTITTMVPRDITGKPDLRRVPAHTRDVLMRTEQSLAREDAILEQLKSELKCAEYLHFYRDKPKTFSSDRSCRYTTAQHPRITAGRAASGLVEETFCLTK